MYSTTLSKSAIAAHRKSLARLESLIGLGWVRRNTSTVRVSISHKVCGVTAPNAHLEQLVLSLFTGRRLDLVLELDDGLKVGVIL
jgi:hypothetical protein